MGHGFGTGGGIILLDPRVSDYELVWSASWTWCGWQWTLSIDPERDNGGEFLEGVEMEWRSQQFAVVPVSEVMNLGRCAELQECNG